MTGHLNIKVESGENGEGHIFVDVDLKNIDFYERISILDAAQSALEMSDEEVLQAVFLKKAIYESVNKIEIDRTKLREKGD